MSKKITAFQVDIGFNTPIDTDKKKEELCLMIDRLVKEVRKGFDCVGLGISFETLPDIEENIKEESQLEELEREEY